MIRVSRKRTIALGVVLALAASLALVLSQTGRSDSRTPPAISALTKLPPQANLPDRVLGFIAQAAGPTQSDPQEIKGRVRLLREGLGVRKLDAYGYLDSQGRPCFFIPGEVGSCATIADTDTPGFYWTIGGGYPDTPSNLIGLATDDVRSVSLIIDGTEVPVSIINNLAFAEYPNTANLATVVVKRADGGEQSASLHLKG